MATPPVETRAFRVAIVSKNPETLDGLEAYLRGAGVDTSSSRMIEHSAQVGSGVSALVIFPDDFDWEAVVPALAACFRSNPRALPVIVTSSPQRFEELAWPDDAAIPLVVPKPAWGFTILDLIRGATKTFQ